MATMAMAGAAWADDGAGYSAYVGASNSWVSAESAGVDIDADAMTLSGAAAFDLRGTFQMQIDGAITDAENIDDPVVGGSLHFVHRAAGWMIGAFAGGSEAEDVSMTAVGAEGAIYFERFTLAAALGYIDSDDLGGDGMLTQVQGRYFFDRNFRVDATLTYASIDAGGSEVDANSLGVGAEYKFTGSHVSVFGSYALVDSDLASFDADIMTLGLRVNLDPDLAARDESGASMLSVPSFATLF
ncbi:MAG: hypothetical protein WDM79_17845 [Terricaulis sp.]